MNKFAALAIAAVLAITTNTRAADAVMADVGSRQGDMHVGLTFNIGEVISPERNDATKRALQAAAFFPTEGNLARLDAARGQAAHYGMICQTSVREQRADFGMAPGVLYAADIMHGAVRDTPYPVQVVTVTQYVARSFTQRVGDHLQRNSTAYTIGGIGALGYGVYAVGDKQGWWGGSDKKETKAAAEEKPAIPTVQGGSAPTVVVSAGDGSPITVNISQNNGVGSAASGAAPAAPVAEEPAVETPAAE